MATRQPGADAAGREVEPDLGRARSVCGDREVLGEKGLPVVPDPARHRVNDAVRCVAVMAVCQHVVLTEGRMAT